MDARQQIEKRIGHKIPQSDYLTLVEPYEGINHLDEIRKSIGSNDIVGMTPSPMKVLTFPFPGTLPFTEEQIAAYRRLHALISSMEVSLHVSYARRTVLEKNRKQILKLLWAFGTFGVAEKGAENIRLDSGMYSSQKISSYRSILEEYVKILKKYNLDCHIIPLDEKIWRTKSGALRSKGWYMELASREQDDDKLLDVLKYYTRLLNKKFGKNAFRYFSRADMRILYSNK